MGLLHLIVQAMNIRHEAPRDDKERSGRTTGRVLHRTRVYDLLAWLMTFGRETAFRDTILDLAALAPGESVLDVGSGTGTLAIRAKQRVGTGGFVCGIDASAEMVAAARTKAKKARADLVFENAIVEALPFPDARFDAVFSTLMMHHLPRPARAQCVSEMRRVRKPGGRVVVVDFGSAQSERRTLLDHFHRHGHVKPEELVKLLEDAGFSITSSGPIGIRDLQFVTATAP